MRHFLVVGLLASLAAHSLAFADPVYPTRSANDGLVSDFAQVIPAAEEATLEKDLRTFEHDTHAELAVVTVNSLDGYDIKDYANGLFRTWGIGKHGADNGVLLLLAPHERKVRIEVGYGLETMLTDADSISIIKADMHDKMHGNDFAGGLIDGAHGIIDHLKPQLIANGSQLMKKATPKEDSSGGIFFWIAALIVLVAAGLFYVWARIVHGANQAMLDQSERKDSPVRTSGNRYSVPTGRPRTTPESVRRARIDYGSAAVISPSSRSNDDDSSTSFSSRRDDDSSSFSSSSDSGFSFGGGSSGGGGADDSF